MTKANETQSDIDDALNKTIGQMPILSLDDKCMSCSGHNN